MDKMMVDNGTTYSSQDFIIKSTNSTKNKIGNSEEDIVVLGIFITVISIVGTLANLGMCAFICFCRKLRKTCHVFIFSLGVSELLLAAIVLPLEAENILRGTWIHTVLVCEISNIFFFLSMSSSILNLLAVSVYRYLTIAFPFPAARCRGRYLIAVLFMLWCYSAFTSMLPTLGWRSKPTYVGDMCYFQYEKSWSMLMTCNFFLPSFVIFIAYFSIYRIAKRHAKQIARDYQMYGPSDRANQPRFFRAAVTLAKLCGCYIICWLPYIILQCLYNFQCLPCREIPRQVHIVFVLLAYGSVIINPFLYSWSSQDFREAIKLCFNRLTGRQRIWQQGEFVQSTRSRVIARVDAVYGKMEERNQDYQETAV